jgi:hypothetical protein
MTALKRDPVVVAVLFAFLSLPALADAAKDYEFLEKCYDGKVSAGKLNVKPSENGYELTGEWKECYEKALELAQQNASDQETVLKMAKLTARRHAQIAAIPIYRVALQGAKDRAPLCEDKDLEYATLQGFHRPADNRFAKDSQWIAFEACFKEMKPQLVDELSKDSAGGYVGQNTCKQLLEKKALSGLMAKLCKKQE